MLRYFGSNFNKDKYGLCPVVFQRILLKYLLEDCLDNKNDERQNSCVVKWKQRFRFVGFQDQKSYFVHSTILTQQNQQIQQQLKMQEPNRSQVDTVNPLIKIVKEREELYFQLLTFVKTHLATSSYDLDNTTIFRKNIAFFDNKHSAIVSKEEELLGSLTDPFAEEQHSQDPISKQMLRLSSRLLQILEGSLSRIQKSVFDDNGRTLKQFSRFKSSLNKILKRQYFVVKDFVQHIISYCTNKFKKQFLKLRKYLQKVQLGDQIWFKELYSMENSDVEQTPNPDRKIKDEQKTVRKLHKKIDIQQHLSSTEERDKKAISLKKTMKPSTKRRQRLLNIKNKVKEGDDQQIDSHKKQLTANKLLKFYVLLDLNKKQFLQDYVYDKMDEEKKKNQLLGKLLERNKTINSQINAFVRKSSNYLPVPILFPTAKSSGDQRNQSASSKLSLRTSFIIKRKSTSHFDTSGNERTSDNQKKQKDQLASTIRNLNPRRRSSHSNPRPQQKSKKIFVVKAPVIFEEEIIPQAPVTQTQWLQAPLTVKGREKRTQSIRLKRKNNVNPLQNAFLPQNFRYPF